MSTSITYSHGRRPTYLPARGPLYPCRRFHIQFLKLLEPWFDDIRPLFPKLSSCINHGFPVILFYVGRFAVSCDCLGLAIWGHSAALYVKASTTLWVLAMRILARMMSSVTQWIRLATYTTPSSFIQASSYQTQYPSASDPINIGHTA